MIKTEWHVKKSAEFYSPLFVEKSTSQRLLIYLILTIGLVVVMLNTSLAQGTQPLGIVTNSVDWFEITDPNVTAEERHNANFVAALTISSPPYETSRIPGWFCSGFLVGPDLLMTAAHCLCISDKEGHCIEPRRIDEDRVRNIIAIFNYEEGVELSQLDAFWCNTFVNWNSDPDLDIALLKCKPGPIGSFNPIRPGEHRGRGFVDLREFDKNIRKDDAIYVIHQNCVDSIIGPPFTNNVCTPYKKLSRGKLLDFKGSNLYHDADTLRGSSGSPIFSKATHRIVGIHKGWTVKGTGVAPDGRNRGTRALDLLGFLRPLRAVTDPYYDDIGSILKRLNYPYIEIQDQDLADYNYIKNFDTIFINCSGDSAANAPAAKESLRKYVENGGALYASDWAFIYIKEAFPGKLFFPDNPYVGVGNQHVTATITDLGLQLYLMQKSVDIYYNLGAWAVMTDVGPGTEVIMRGDVQVWTGTETREPEPIYQGGGAKSLQYLSPPVTAQGIETWTDKPLAASFEYGDGFVIYTTFHNEPQLTELQQKLLEYFIIKPITAKIAKWLGDKLDSLNYLIKQKIINIINKGAKKTFSYVVDKIKDIIIALGFEGSRFRVSVYRPDGSLYTQVESETSPIIIEIPGAEPGEWTFTVEALDVPYDNYPIVILIGEAGGKLLTASQKALDLIEKADLEKLQVFKGLTTFYDALSELETEVGSLIIDIEQNMLDGNIAQSLADPLTKLVDEDGRPKAPLLVISALLSYKDMDLIEMDKLLEQADEYESEALAQLSIVATACGGNADCEQNAAKKALEALDQSIKLMKEAEKHIWGIKDEIKAILAWICGFQQLVTRASSADITSDYRAELLSRARDLIDLTMDLLEVLREGIFAAMVKVKDLKVEARATIESILKFSAASSSSAASSLGVPNLWAYADKGTIHFMALSSTVRSLRVQVFNLAGREIFDSGMVLGNQISWQPQAVANGVYLYIVTVRGWDETILRSEVKKLVILR